MTAGETDDAVDFCEVGQGVVEEHQVHLFVFLVVVVVAQEFVEFLLYGVEVPAVFVESWIHEVDFSWLGSHIVSKEYGIHHNILEAVLKVSLDQIGDHLLPDQFPILLGDEPIRKDPFGLVPPQPHKGLLSWELIHRTSTQALINPTQIPQVEDVVEFDGGTWELVDDLLVQLQSALGDLLDAFGDFRGERGHVGLQN